ncbi:MAG TPA: ABC transporter permease [Candidatus Acidoferrales bacterium]|nr:ABC transporter permease [Candidatus Acidoferrales bacterium]
MRGPAGRVLAVGAWRRFAVRLAGLWSTGRQERELAEELASHFQMHVEENLRRGMSAEEARRDARLKFGSVDAASERMRDGWTLMALVTARQDLQYALRGLRRNPGFAVTAIASLALGIGASVAIFTIADNLLLRPLPYRDPGQLVMLWEVNQVRNFRPPVVAAANYLDWKAQNSVFESMAGLREAHSVLNDGNRVEDLGKQLISADLLPLLGVQPVRGRLFTAAEDRESASTDTVLLISYRVWQNWFHGDEGVIGRKVQVNATPRVIIGVLPPGFYFRNRNVDLWEPLGLGPAEKYRYGGRWMVSVARLKTGVTGKRAQAEMAAIAARLATAYPGYDKDWTVQVEDLRDSLVREVKTSTLILLGAVGLLLAVACANVANLLLARYASRRREMAVRAAIGAGRWRVIRQLLTESMVLGIGGGLLGVTLARWAVSGLLLLAPKDLSRNAVIVLDLRIVLFAVALSVLTGVLFGLAPALVVSRADLARGMGEDSRGSVGAGGQLRSVLVAAEVALSVMLLAGAGLLFRSLVGLQSVDLGLNPTKLLTFRVSIPAARYRDYSRRTQFYARATEQLGHLPGVRSLSAIDYLPFAGGAASTWVAIGGRPPAKLGEELIATIRTVMPGYFRTMGIPIARGRDFTEADNSQDAPYRFIVNEAFVRKYLTGEPPLGQQINANMDTANPFGEIVGVAADAREDALDKEPAPTVYYVYAHLATPGLTFLVRSATDPMALAEPARKIIQGLDPQQPVAEVRTMETVVRETFSRQRFSALLLGGFSLVSLLLAAVGIYGVLAFSVTERTREIGVRVALGADPARIRALVMASGLRVVLAGTAMGTGGALALTGLLESLLFGVKAHDGATFVTAPAVLIGVAMLAAYLPARRAARLAPVDALRGD